MVASAQAAKEKLLTLEQWAFNIYGENAPGINTLRRWAREDKIFPLAQKHGRTYFVRPSAEYVEDYSSLVSRLS